MSVDSFGPRDAEVAERRAHFHKKKSGVLKCLQRETRGKWSNGQESYILRVLGDVLPVQRSLCIFRGQFISALKTEFDWLFALCNPMSEDSFRVQIESKGPKRASNEISIRYTMDNAIILR